MITKGINYGSCDECGVMVDLEHMKDYGLLQGHPDHDTQEPVGQTCWNGHTQCYTWDCPVCGCNNDTQIQID